MIELAVGLVALLAVFAGLLQLGRLARARTEVMTDARAEAAANAMSDVYLRPLPGPQFIYDWQPGSDGKTYSQDDTAQAAATALVSQELLGPAKTDELQLRLPGNAVSALDGSSLVEGFSLVQGSERSEPIALYPIVRDLLYGRDSIRIEGETWLTWTKGLY